MIIYTLANIYEFFSISKDNHMIDDEESNESDAKDSVVNSNDQYVR